MQLPQALILCSPASPLLFLSKEQLLGWPCGGKRTDKDGAGDGADWTWGVGEADITHSVWGERLLRSALDPFTVVKRGQLYEESQQYCKVIPMLA